MIGRTDRSQTEKPFVTAKCVCFKNYTRWTGTCCHYCQPELSQFSKLGVFRPPYVVGMRFILLDSPNDSDDSDDEPRADACGAVPVAHPPALELFLTPAPAPAPAPATDQTTWAKYVFPFSPATRNMHDLMNAGFEPKYRRVRFSDKPEIEIQPRRWSVSAASPSPPTCPRTPTAKKAAKSTPRRRQSMSSAQQAEPRRSTREPKARDFYIPG